MLCCTMQMGANMAHVEHAERIRGYLRERFVRAARRKGVNRFQIRAGDVVKALDLKGRVPTVCSALRSRKFLRENGLEIVEVKGPTSGQSTTLTVTYQFGKAEKETKPSPHPLLSLVGIGKGVFSSL